MKTYLQGKRAVHSQSCMRRRINHEHSYNCWSSLNGYKKILPVLLSNKPTSLPPNNQKVIQPLTSNQAIIALHRIPNVTAREHVVMAAQLLAMAVCQCLLRGLLCCLPGWHNFVVKLPASSLANCSTTQSQCSAAAHVSVLWHLPSKSIMGLVVLKGGIVSAECGDLMFPSTQNRFSLIALIIHNTISCKVVSH